ncbi:MAG: DUF4352 domain-containing protein [Euryarchaeota archaeon]|nr:DUF4352 domain-containing protein [Euryarchaeota archaeon]
MTALRKCNRCGAESGDNAQFCHRCGNTLTMGAYGQPMLYRPYEPPQKKDQTGMILAVIVVVILAAALIAGAVVMSNAVRDMPWKDWTTADIDMSVDSYTYYDNPSSPPFDGFVYVQLTLTVNNDGAQDLAMDPDMFLLFTSDDQYFGYTTSVPESVPSSISSGSSASFYVGFMIPENLLPSLLEMDVPGEFFGSVTAVVPS